MEKYWGSTFCLSTAYLFWIYKHPTLHHFITANYQAATLSEYFILPILPSDNMLLFNTAASPPSDNQPLFQSTNTIITTLFCIVMINCCKQKFRTEICGANKRLNHYVWWREATYLCSTKHRGLNSRMGLALWLHYWEHTETMQTHYSRNAKEINHWRSAESERDLNIKCTTGM